MPDGSPATAVLPRWPERAAENMKDGQARHGGITPDRHG